MIMISELKHTPISCSECPCKLNGSMDGPPVCLIRVLIDGDYFNNYPKIELCPLKEVSEN